MAPTDSDQQQCSSVPCFGETSDTCRDKELGKALVLYQTGMMNSKEEHEFEAHLLECDACFDTLRSLDEAMGHTLEALLEKKSTRSEDVQLRPARNPAQPRN